MDPLTDILQDLRLERGFYARSNLRAPWGLAFSVEDGPSFHVIVMVHCFLRLGTERIPLRAGDLVLLPHAVAHQLANPAESPAVPLAALPSERIGDHAALLRYGGDGERSLLICGGVCAPTPPHVLFLHQCIVMLELLAAATSLRTPVSNDHSLAALCGTL